MNTQETIIADLTAARANIVARAKTVPRARRTEIFLGKWSVLDLLAHLAGWDYANIDSVNDIRAHKSPRVFQYFNPDWAAFNAQLVKQYRRDNWREMLVELNRSHRALITLLRTLDPDDFERDYSVRSPRGRKVTIAAHLQAEIDDEHEHSEQIDRWLNSLGIRDT